MLKAYCVLAYWVYTFTDSFNFNSLKSQQTIGHAKSIDMTLFKKLFFEARNHDFFQIFPGILCFLLSRLPLVAIVLHPYNIDLLLGFGDPLCCFSHLLTAHPPKISGTTPVKNMKIRLCLSLDTFDTRCLVFVHERPLVIVSCFENEFNFDICCRSEQNIDY